MKAKGIICAIVVSIFFITLASAGSQPIIVNTGSINEDFSYVLNYSTDSICSDVILSYSEIITTDSLGLGLINVPLSLLNRYPSFICEYRDGSLRKVHNVSTQVFDDIWADEIRVDNIYSNNWSNVSIKEDQIINLAHYISSDFDTDFSGKDTDDLSEGSNNLYDNQTWNESGADLKYLQTETDPTIWNSIFNNTLTNWITSWFSSQDTDDLTEGSINLYDNQNWNESRGDNIYVNIDGDTMTGDLEVPNLNVTGNSTTVFETCYKVADGSKFCIDPDDEASGRCKNATTGMVTITANITKAIEDGIWC